MAETVEIQMPQMGESVTEGTVLEWHKQEGEFVSEGETVVEVSTDKIDAEVPAPASGVITRILKAPDETIEVGGVLAELDASAEPSGDGASANGAGEERQTGPGLTEGATGEGDQDLGDETEPSASPDPGQVKTVTPAEPSGESLQITMPEMGESVTEGTVLEWHVAEGEAVAEGDTVIEVSTDKIDAEVPAPASGVITKLLVSPDDTVQVGQALAEMAAGATAPTDGEAAPAEAPAAAPTGPAADGGNGGRASPVARRVAAKNGVDLDAVHGSGPGGKVTKADVLAVANGGDGTLAKPGPVSPARTRRRAQDAGEVVPLRGPA